MFYFLFTRESALIWGSQVFCRIAAKSCTDTLICFKPSDWSTALRPEALPVYRNQSGSSRTLADLECRTVVLAELAELAPSVVVLSLGAVVEQICEEISRRTVVFFPSCSYKLDWRTQCSQDRWSVPVVDPIIATNCSCNYQGQELLPAKTDNICRQRS